MTDPARADAFAFQRLPPTDAGLALPTRTRAGFEDAVVRDILGKLDLLADSGRTLVDIGGGAGGVTDRLLAFAGQQAHRLVLLDTSERLARLPEAPHIVKVSGRFPDQAPALRRALGPGTETGADAVLCYGILHVLFVDTNPFAVLDHLIDLLAPGGSALIGDVPNLSKRKRFYASARGIAYHRTIMNTIEPPVIRHYAVEHDQIDDTVLAALMRRAQIAGCDAYLMPQARDLPLADRRDDLLIRKP